MRHALHKMRNYWKHLKTGAKPINKCTKRFSKMNKQQNDHWEQWTKCKGQSETMRDKVLSQKYKNKRPKMKQTGLRCRSMRTRIRGAKKSSEKNFFIQNKTKRTWSPWFETKNKNQKMVSNFDAQFTEQQIDFLKEEEDKKTKNKRTRKQLRFTSTRITIVRIGQKPWPQPKKTKHKKQVFNTKKKHVKRNTKKNRDSDSKSLLPENKDKRGGRINFQKQNSGRKPRLLICEVARSLEKERVGRWRKEGKGRKGKVKSKS